MKNLFYAVGRSLALVGFIVLVAGLAACTTPTGDSPAAGDPPPPAPSSAGPLANQVDPELLQVGDTLFITFHDLPTATMPVEAQIRPDGTITLMEDQTFKAAGMTRSKLEREIRDRYVPAYFRSMTVLIKPKEDTRLYYVGGEVRAPGGQFYRTRTTVIKAIQSAGDFTDFANKRKVELTRSGASKPIIINANKARTNSALDLEVYPGDRIHVPRRVIW